MSIEIQQFPCLSDNYGFLVHDAESGETVAIDTPDGDEYLRQADARGWKITQIWNTHWHPDHAGGNLAIKQATGCRITAPALEKDRIAGADFLVSHGDSVRLGDTVAEVIDVGGHTLGHIAYHMPGQSFAFVGDSVFALGCGRMFEGTADQMWTSLKRIKALPTDTTLYCAHEYTLANAKFALSVDGGNAALQDYAEEVQEKRARDVWTVPTRLDRELAANPFLRADDPALQAAMGHVGDAVATFAEVRRRKDNF